MSTFIILKIIYLIKYFISYNTIKIQNLLELEHIIFHEIIYLIHLNNNNLINKK